MNRTPGAERLQKVIARSGLASRRSADAMIVAGRVAVDGRVASPGQIVDPAKAEVLVDGIRLPVDPRLVHYLLHKPLGVISTTRDPQGRPTVVDLVPSRPRVYPVGRLDADTTGLLLLTNDGNFANVVTHPRFGVVKTYEVLVDGVPNRRDLASMRRGVRLEDGPARPVSVRRIGSGGHRTHLETLDGRGAEPGGPAALQGGGLPGRATPPHLDRSLTRPGAQSGGVAAAGGPARCGPSTDTATIRYSGDTVEPGKATEGT